MKRPSLQELVFNKIIPQPKQNDPVSFYTHVQRNLVPEVRLEVQTFYGSLDCLEAQYPGLDYTFAPHRRRLSRYPWHRRLFRTFDELRLTDGEILSLCQWEGTRSAKERFEAETKKKIIDTTADDVEPAPQSHGPRARYYHWDVQDATTPASGMLQNSMETEAAAEQSDEDEMTSSIGLQLNQQLQAAVAARSRGEMVSVDAQWEQWMKEAIERNDIDRETVLQAIRDGHTFLPRTASVSGSSLSIPSGSNTSHISNSTATTTIPPHFHTSQRYEDLSNRLHNLQSANNRLAADNAAMAMLLSRTYPETAR